MKLISAELIDVASHVMGPATQTRTLMPPTHEIELQSDGWLHWRVKGGTWHLSPPSMLRNVEVYEDVPTDSIVKLHDEDLDMPLASGDVLPIRKRGRPAKSV